MGLSINIDAMLKSRVCDKIQPLHMSRTIYAPSCLRYCSELCGIRCKGLCNLNHTDCSRGVLPAFFAHCPAVDTSNLALDFISFESREVETFGKGKAFSRIEKIATQQSYDDFLLSLEKEFSLYSEHTLSYWFLRATKIEAFAPSESRATVATITCDFGEAIQIVAKHETSDQFYKRPEVHIKYILIFLNLYFFLGLYLWCCLRDNKANRKWRL